MRQGAPHQSSGMDLSTPKLRRRFPVSRRVAGLMLAQFLAGVALLGCMAYAADPGASPADTTVASTPTTTPNHAAAISPPDAQEPASAVGASGNLAEAVSDAAPTTAEEVAPAAIAAGSPYAWRIEIPSIGVGAPMISLGLDAGGTMEVPNDGFTVGWYQFTAAPGASGNAVVAAHVDYRGASGVFQRLSSLAEGDQVSMQVEGHTVTYVVDSVTLVRPELADVAAIIGAREGAATLTLITCGGNWDSARRDYDHRVIVTASLAVVDRAS